MTYRRRKREKEHTRNKHRVGAVQQRILLLLLGGLALGCSHSPRTSWKIIRAVHREWKDINKQSAKRALTALYESRLIATHKNRDDTMTVTLSDNGRKRALTYNLATMQIKQPLEWDKLWRIVSFDIPEEKHEVRDVLRSCLLNLGFFELQQSILVHPFECWDEIEYLAGLYDVRPYIRFIRATYIDNEPRLRKFFRLY